MLDPLFAVPTALGLAMAFGVFQGVKENTSPKPPKVKTKVVYEYKPAYYVAGEDHPSEGRGDLAPQEARAGVTIDARAAPAKAPRRALRAEPERLPR